MHNTDSDRPGGVPPSRSFGIASRAVGCRSQRKGHLGAATLIFKTFGHGPESDTSMLWGRSTVVASASYALLQGPPFTLHPLLLLPTTYASGNRNLHTPPASCTRNSLLANLNQQDSANADILLTFRRRSAGSGGYLSISPLVTDMDQIASPLLHYSIPGAGVIGVYVFRCFQIFCT
ncbi:hypothetical protein CC80DRAFT_105325 [Byssothecium circinans]|uniref:Uncharacterized protein n=1 Tax=Byssothecium circinans TaxID=147558 RepID=A0A6A5UDU8_9PLEO|nr:hypothetical protein CC80DRAFT_105325 [Byssothecium circinans]